jgi:hypothetical protein
MGNVALLQNAHPPTYLMTIQIEINVLNNKYYALYDALKM